jgi:zinc protease
MSATHPRTRLLSAPLLIALLVIPSWSSPAAAQETEPPPPMEQRPIEFPGFEEFTLENGLRVVVLTYGTQPVATVRLYAPGGGRLEPLELAGLASMTATVLTKGTGTRSAVEISETIEGLGGSLSAAGLQDEFYVTASALTDHLTAAFELMADVVKNATFPEDEVELARRQQLSSLQAQLGQPQAIAGRRFASVLYGDEHPYGVGSTPESVRAIRRDDLVAFRDRVLRPEGSLLLVAGRVERDEVERLARTHLGDWTGRAATPPALSVPPGRDRTHIYLVHRPGSVQSNIALGHLGIEPDNPDYFPLEVMNRILGGGSDSRLFRILREERGWTYGAYSQFTRPAEVGRFQAGAEVRTEVTDSTVVELLHQMERLRSEPVPADELDAARNYLAGSFPLRLETAGQVAGQLASTLLRGLPMDDLTRYPERIRAVTGEEVRRVAREYLHPDRSAIVVVGDASAVLESLEAIAPVSLFDVEGGTLSRDEVLGAPEAVAWDASRLEEELRRYEFYVQGNPMGVADYRLERDGDDWVSTQTMSAMGSSQETRLRFSAADLSPRSLDQELAQGPMNVQANLEVADGMLRGNVNLPPQMGGAREVQEAFPDGTFLPGMEEFALAVADLDEGVRLSIAYYDVMQGNRVTLEARVRGREEVTVSAGAFDAWRVELSGGQMPMILYLRVESPHILIRQDFGGQPIRLDLSARSPL